MLGVPVVLDHEVVAVLKFFSKDQVTPNGLLGAAMRTVASLLAHTIERSWNVQRLEEGEARFRALVEHAHDVITGLDADGTIRYSSPSATQMLGYPGSHPGTVVFDFVHPDDRDRVQSALQSLVDGGSRAGPLEFRLAHADKSWHDVEATATNVADEPAIEGAIVVNTRDVSERSRAEAQLAHGRLHVDTPMDCPEPVRWVGRAVVGRRRLKHWSSGRHLEGLDDLRPVGNRYITHPIGIATMICDGSDSLDDPEPIVDSHRAPIADWLRLSTEVGLVDSDVRLICPDSADHYHSANDHAVGNKPGATRKRPPIFRLSSSNEV